MPWSRQHRTAVEPVRSDFVHTCAAFQQAHMHQALTHTQVVFRPQSHIINASSNMNASHVVNAASLVVNASPLSACPHTCHLLCHSNHDSMLSYVLLAQGCNRHVKCRSGTCQGTTERSFCFLVYCISDTHPQGCTDLQTLVQCQDHQDPISDPLCDHVWLC